MISYHIIRASDSCYGITWYLMHCSLNSRGIATYKVLLVVALLALGKCGKLL